jgi:hypothetical protein
VDVLTSYIEKWVPPSDVVGKKFLDSGAFSAWNSGKEIVLSEYIDYCHNNGEWDIVAGLDVIGCWQQSKKNYIDMRDDGIDILPTFHIGEPWDYYQWMLSEWSYVALGGMVPYLSIKNAAHKPALIRWLIKCHKLADMAGVRLHGFGCTTWNLVKMFDWGSVDSTSWSVGQRFGRVLKYGMRTSYDNQNYNQAAKDAKRIGLNYSRDELTPTRGTDECSSERYKAILHFNIMIMLDSLAKLNERRQSFIEAGIEDPTSYLSV